MKRIFFLIAVCLSLLSCTEDHFPSYLDLGYSPQSQDEYDVPDDGSVVVAEIDWTKRSEYYDDIWYSEGCTVSVNQGEGLVIESNPEEGANYWEPQVPMIGHIATINEGGQYQVKFQFNSPVAGELRLDFYSWDGSGANMGTVFEVAEGDNDMTIEFLNYPTTCTNAGIFYQPGKLPGKHIIKRVQVLDLEGEKGGESGEVGPAIVAEVDWTQKSEWDLGWYAEGCTVTVNQGEGLIIDCTPPADAQYWEPQVPMIGHIATINEGGQYQVKFQFNSPVAGELRLDFYSWDGSGATMATVFEVAEGDNDFTIDFFNYPTTCTDAGIFYQPGKLPGKHIIKRVQVLDVGGVTRGHASRDVIPIDNP